MGLYWNCTDSGEILSVIWVYTGTVLSGEILGVIWVYTGTVPIMGRS